MTDKNTPEVCVEDMVAEYGAIHLDIGCGENKQPGFFGIDKRDVPGVDCVHDLETFPYPLPDDSCSIILGSHIVEHIKPWLMPDFMNELWRIMRPAGELMLSHPYGVNSGFVQDPTHCNPCNEATWMYFCPEMPKMLGGGPSPLYPIYKPKPWKVKPGTFTWHQNGNMEIVLVKLEEAPDGENQA